MDTSTNLLNHLRRQFAYNAWANKQVLAALRSQTADERSLDLMSHILGAERLWLERITGQPQSTPVWPKSDLAQCDANAEEMSSRWPEFLGSLKGDLAQPVSYKNSKGEAWTSTVIDILTHVIMHSAYHRGQIASHMREIGQTPAYTDFIHGVRQGFVR